MKIFIDESGDLGFTFKNAYGAGGSSRFLTIAFLMIPDDIDYLPKRIVRQVYKKKKWDPARSELKGSMLDENTRNFFAKKVRGLLTQHPEIKVFTMTVAKEKVYLPLRVDPNILYNYIIGLSILDKIDHISKVTLIPDKRSLKVASGNSLEEYLRIKLWYEMGVRTDLYNKPQESHTDDCLQFIDYIAHIVWRSYELGDNQAKQYLDGVAEFTNLFF